MTQKYHILILSLLYQAIICTSKDVDFCNDKLSCNGSPHVICTLKHNCNVNPKCRNPKIVLLTEKQKQDIVDAHNNFRNLVATGNALPGLNGYKLPTASDMAEIVWDKELEFVAQCWANQCNYVMHDQCRTKTDGTNVGQNIAVNSEDSIAGEIKRFYNEIQNVTAKDITTFGYSNLKIGHFTQVVYSLTTHVGCGRIKYTEGSFDVFLLVCNYAVSGNWKNQKVYTPGKPCATCPDKCHSKYTGLCKTDPSTSETPTITAKPNKKIRSRASIKKSSELFVLLSTGIIFLAFGMP